MNEKTIGVGVVGLGFMGSTHVAAYQSARDAGYPCRLVSVCDRDPARLGGELSSDGNFSTTSGELAFDPAETRGHSSYEEFLAADDLHVVSICTHTDTHTALAIQALEAGKHVLVEKPVALLPEDVARVRAAAEQAGTRCLPAFCVRFWPGWDWLYEQIQSGALGSVRSALFQRIGTPPNWATDFYRDPSRSGSALVDLHIHDADFVRWCFGDPTSVTSHGTPEHVATVYDYDGGPEFVMAEGSWRATGGYPFRMSYRVIFEEGTAEYELGRDPHLVLHRDGEAQPVELASQTGYELQVRHLLEAIQDPAIPLRATLEDAEAVAALLQAEGQQLDR